MEELHRQGNGELHHEDPPAKESSRTEALPPKSTPDLTPGSTAKGFGLRRWRRVKRDVSKEDSSGSDCSRILKRGLSISESTKVSNDNLPKGNFQEEEFSVSVDSRTVESVSSFHSPDLEILETATGFSVGMNSEDGDERIGREGLGNEKERDRVRNLRGKSLGQRGKGVSLEIKKKIRGDQAVKPEKEDSHSSVESDLRNFDAEYERFDGAKSNGILEHGKEEDVEETAREDLKRDASGEDDVEEREVEASPDHDEDPFSEPLDLLHAAQETLEREIQNLGEISKDLSSWPNESQKETQEKEMNELDGLFRKSVEGEVNCLVLSAAVREQRRRGERKKVVVLERQLEQIAESCKGLERVEEVLRLQNGVCRVSFYWLAQVVLLLLAMVAVVEQIFFSAGSGGSAVPT